MVNKKWSGAFTLLEVLITISLAAIFLSLALPSFSQLLKRQKADSTIQQLATTIRYARSEAIRLGKIITICFRNERNECQADGHKDWIVFIDEDGRGVWQPGKRILRKTKITDYIQWSSFPATASLQLHPTGLTNYQHGTLLYCPKDKNSLYARALFINKTARLRFSSPAKASNHHLDGSNNPLECPH